jgi:hypothetical protein
MGGRIDIETDDVAQLVDEARVGGEFELFHPVRLQAVRAPDALDGTRADANHLRHHPKWGLEISVKNQNSPMPASVFRFMM